MKRLNLLIIVLVAVQFMTQAQEVETLPDSIKKVDNPLIENNLDSLEMQKLVLEKILLPPLDPNTLDLSFNPLFYNPDRLGFDVKYIQPRFDYFSDEYLTIYPIRFGFDTGFEGGDLLGVNNHFQLTDFLTGNLGFTFSSSYYGPMYPQRYNNGSVSLDLTWRLHDRIRINTYGQYSVREGINPAYSPMINGGNYYGGEIQVKIVKNFGIGIGFVNSYYRKNWTLQPTARPVIFD
jgi:hypothetical protein